MAISLASIITGVQISPIIMAVFGVAGVGKTTLAAAFPVPVFINAENGQGLLNVSRFPTVSSWQDIMDAITCLYTDEHNFQTLVLDSADWAEAMCTQHVCIKAGHANIEDFGYGKGYKIMRDEFSRLFRALSALSARKHMHIVVLAHTHLKKFDDPERQAYDRYVMKLDEKNSDKLMEWVDILAFANYDTVITESGEGFEKTKLAKSYGKHILFLERAAAYDAKNRFNLPSRIEMPKDAPASLFFAAYNEAIANATANQQTTNQQTTK